jgi:DNA-binding HxlR family transcriptional regulator
MAAMTLRCSPDDRRAAGPYRSGCALASTLDLVGDKWTLLVLRMLMAGAGRFRDLQAMPEAIAPNILADRLRRLEAHGLIRRYSDGPRRADSGYRLTPVGADLLPAMQALAAWGHAHIPGRWQPPDWFMAATPRDLLDPGLPERLPGRPAKP